MTIAIVTSHDGETLHQGSDNYLAGSRRCWPCTFRDRHGECWGGECACEYHEPPEAAETETPITEKE